MCLIFRFPVWWPRNEVKAQNINCYIAFVTESIDLKFYNAWQKSARLQHTRFFISGHAVQKCFQRLLHISRCQSRNVSCISCWSAYNRGYLRRRYIGGPGFDSHLEHFLWFSVIIDEWHFQTIIKKMKLYCVCHRNCVGDSSLISGIDPFQDRS